MAVALELSGIAEIGCKRFAGRFNERCGTAYARELPPNVDRSDWNVSGKLATQRIRSRWFERRLAWMTLILTNMPNLLSTAEHQQHACRNLRFQDIGKIDAP